MNRLLGVAALLLVLGTAVAFIPERPPVPPSALPAAFTYTSTVLKEKVIAVYQPTLYAAADGDTLLRIDGPARAINVIDNKAILSKPEDVKSLLPATVKQLRATAHFIHLAGLGADTDTDKRETITLTFVYQKAQQQLVEFKLHQKIMPQRPTAAGATGGK